MRWISILIIAAIMGLIIYYALNPPKPKVVIVGPPQTSTTASTTAAAPPQTTTQISPVVLCNSTYLSIPQKGFAACNVKALSQGEIEVDAPGWISGRFMILSMSGTCTLSTGPNMVSVSGQSCEIVIIPSS